MAKLSVATADRMVLESTRVFLEKLFSDLIAEDMKDPETRAWFLDRAGIDYRKAKRRLSFPKSKRKPSGKR